MNELAIVLAFVATGGLLFVLGRQLDAIADRLEAHVWDDLHAKLRRQTRGLLAAYRAGR